MKILIVGSSGMAGHMIYDYLSMFDDLSVMGMSRTQVNGINSVPFDLFTDKGVQDIRDYVAKDKPDVVINCVGMLIKESAARPMYAVYTNGYFPHALALLCADIGARLIHISTDCVFDGLNGPYNECAVPDETNWYGRSKAIGEVQYDNTLTLRTSIIGPDLKPNGPGLFNWFIKQEGKVFGFTNVHWNGITTLELAKQIKKILGYPHLSGLYHLTRDGGITKYGLLREIKSVYGLDKIKIVRDHKPESNKCLTNNRKEEYNPLIPGYRNQLLELKRFQCRENA